MVGREGRFTPQIESGLKELSVILCLGAKESGEVRGDVAGQLYKRLLREEVTSRRLDAAASPAQVGGGGGAFSRVFFWGGAGVH